MSDTLSLQQRRQVYEGAVRLHREFAGVFSEETIERLLADSLDRLLSDARVMVFVPLLAERFARERLHSAAKIEGARVTDKPTVMFLCVHNAGRSQMAAGWLRHLAGERVDVLSGGSTPAEQVNPAAIEAMREVGIDITDQYPKPWTSQTLGAADVIVTMGCGDACPVYPGKRYLDWELDDPAGKPVEEVRGVRDDIEGRVRALLDDLEVSIAIPN
ncbi:MAG: arsenate reductase ArsC [Euzebyales bacterium]|nr:arsenate reductase ArsC [Euzebyales bacterium]